MTTPVAPTRATADGSDGPLQGLDPHGRAGALARLGLEAAGPITLAAVAGLVWLAYDAGDPRRPMAGVLLVVLAVAVRGIHGWGRRPAPATVRLGLSTLVGVLLALLGANDVALVVLGFLLASDAMSSLRPAVGWRWVAGLAALTTLHFATRAAEPLAGLLMGLGAGGGYAFLGSAALARRRAEALLAELRVAHGHLRASAAQAEALAVARERERLAREMHDTLGHRLTVAAVQLEGASRLVEAEPARARGMIETVRGQIAEGLAELRATVGALRSPADQAPLPDDLARLVAVFDAATGIRTALALPPGPDAPTGPPARALLRAAQEGLTNVQRHSGAARAWVELAAEPGGWRLEVRDDGTGPPPASDGPGDGPVAGAASGHGLRGLAERAAALGGSVTVDRAPEGGARLVLCVPASVPEPAGAP